MSNQVPEGWTEAPLGKFVASSTAGEWGQEGNGDFNDIPVLRATNFTSSGIINYKKLAIRNIDEKKRDKKTLSYGDIVIEKSGGSPTQPVGRVIYFDKDEPFLYSNFTQKLSPTKSIDSKFLFYRFFFEYESGAVLKFQQQTTGIINLQLPEYLLYKSIFPPLPEQQKIAAILTSVDDVIEKTQAQINKLKNLKTGMMQELLTRGVSVDDKPHTEFKDSPVGRIPKGWDCCLLDKVAKRGSGHTPDKQKSEYWNGGIKWVSLTDSSKLDKLHLYKTSKEISQLGIDNSSATLHPSGTVVMARDAGIGKSAIIQSPMAVSQHFMAWVCSDKLDNYFLYYLLQYWKPKFENIAMGSTIKTIGLPFFKKLQIPLPSIDEQKIIAKSLKAVESNIFKLEEKNAKSQAMKKALMQDLLTGKVRVEVE